ncbi:MAG: hypothetical protein AAFV80_20490 [Bacteroidota bacterium]
MDLDSTSPSSSVAKQKGAHVYNVMDSLDFEFLHEHHIEWVTLITWGGQEAIDSPEMRHHNKDSTYIQEVNSRMYKRIMEAREAGFKVFVKPHLWIRVAEGGGWRSDVFPQNDSNWLRWQESYRDYIFRFAQIAEAAKAEQFCIGAELTRLTTEKPEFWIQLIQDVREMYSGKLTYAANWYHEYENIMFWDQLDFIGVQAYFPLSNKDQPSVEQLSAGWQKHLETLEGIHKQFQRPILFTEMGYKSTPNGAERPWEWAEHLPEGEKKYTPEVQTNAYQAFFKSVWPQDWFAGVQLWVLFADYPEERKDLTIGFSPQGKPAMEVLRIAFE